MKEIISPSSIHPHRDRFSEEEFLKYATTWIRRNYEQVSCVVCVCVCVCVCEREREKCSLFEANVHSRQKYVSIL